MRRFGGTLLLAAVVLAPLAYILRESQGPDAEGHYRGSSTLRELARRDADVGRLMLVMSVGSADDGLELTATLAAMERLTEELPPGDDALVQAARLLDRKAQLVREFFTRNAQLRASVASLPFVFAAASRRLAAGGERALEQKLNRLAREVFVLAASPATAEKPPAAIVMLLEAMMTEGTAAEGEAGSAFALVRDRVELLLQEKPAVARIVDAVRALAAGPLYEEALARLDARFARDLGRTSRLRVLFYLLASALLVLVALTMGKLRSHSRNLTHRVAERTRELVRAEGVARAGEKRLRAMIDAATDGIALLDREDRITDLNPAAQSLLGLSRAAAAGRELASFLSHGAMGQPASGRFEAAVTRADGAAVPAEISLAPLDGNQAGSRVLFLRDVSQARQLEADLRHAQKLEAVGRLAAGIAHEINTPVQFVGDSVRFLLDADRDLLRLIDAYRVQRPGAELEVLEEEVDLRYLREALPRAGERALDGVDRIATVVNAMRDFVRPDQGTRTPADLNRALQSTLIVAGNEIKYIADVDTDFGAIPQVPCYLSEVKQVFLNLLMNAAHAIADAKRGRGRITVQTRGEGDHVVVTIGDNGCGIPEPIRSKIFEPFYTTKEVGRGTGPGLAIARAIVVDKHRGALTLESEVGRGSMFTIRFPRQAPAEEAA